MVWNGLPMIAVLSLFVAPGTSLADDGSPPSIDLLMYIAEWKIDARGVLLDPMAVPDEIDIASDIRSPDQQAAVPDGRLGDP